MAVRHYRAQVVIPHDNGLPEDSVVNTWHYTATDAQSDVLNATDFNAQLDVFYTAWVPSFGSTQMDWSNTLCHHTCFEELAPRIPFFEGAITPGTPPGSNSDWPPDVAVVLSMQASRASGFNMRRRRGRVYLGPLSFASGDQPILDVGSADAIANAADTAFFGAGSSVLSVYSPYTHHGVPVGENIKDYPDEQDNLLAGSFHEVVRVWVDNGFDTQRRRGTRASYRKTNDK